MYADKPMRGHGLMQAIAIMLEKYEVACDILLGFDWTLRETARAKIRVIVKRILNKWGYPPDLQEEAVKTVLQQAELLCADWS
jgi:hypothetical protein